MLHYTRYTNLYTEKHLFSIQNSKFSMIPKHDLFRNQNMQKMWNDSFDIIIHEFMKTLIWKIASVANKTATYHY